MSSTGLAATLLGTALLNKKPNLRGFVKTLQIAEEKQEQAIAKLNQATEDLRLTMEGNAIAAIMKETPVLLQLSEHFTLAEMTLSQTAARHGVSNEPNVEAIEHLRRTAGVMENVRSLLGSKPIIVSSGYRSPEVNKLIGGAEKSAHILGLAVDFTCPTFGTPLQICQAIAPHVDALGIDQLIFEFNSWVHLGLALTPARHQVLTINNYGVQTGLVA